MEVLYIIEKSLFEGLSSFSIILENQCERFFYIYVEWIKENKWK